MRGGEKGRKKRRGMQRRVEKGGRKRKQMEVRGKEMKKRRTEERTESEMRRGG